jgi:hypothetical protein
MGSFTLRLLCLSAEYHNTVKKTLVVLLKRYELRKLLLYLKTGHNHFLSNPLKFLQPDHPLTYITHCINSADGNKILLTISITFYMIFELELQNKANCVVQNERKFGN